MLAQQPHTDRHHQARHPIELLLVDDHHAVLDALATALGREPDMVVVGTACSIDEVAHTRRRPDVAVVDYGLPDGTGADACRLIKARWPDTRIVMLSGSASEADFLAMIRAGADGCVTKAQRLGVLIGVLRDVYAGRPTVSPELLGRIARSLRDPHPTATPVERLTPRELGVLRALAAGHSTRVIAGELGIAEGTVLRHVESIRRKFDVGSRLEAVTKALQHHIIQAPGPPI